MLLLWLEAPTISDPPRRTPERPVSDQDQTYFVGQSSDVVAGRTVTLRIPVLGEPAPSVTWTLPSGRRMRPGDRYDRFSVTDDGALQIKDSRIGDTGSYRVTASNAAGQRSVVIPVAVFGETFALFMYSNAL